MKRTFLLAFLGAVFCSLFSCSDRPQQFFSINGTIEGFSPKLLRLNYDDLDSGSKELIIPFRDGKFSLTAELNSAQTATLHIDTLLSRTIFIAPGYQMELKMTGSKDISFEGRGSRANQLLASMDTITTFKRQNDQTLTGDSFFNALVKDRDYKMSRLHYYSLEYDDPDDEYYQYLREVLKTDILFNSFTVAMSHINTSFDSYTEDEVNRWTEYAFGRDFIKNISDPDYLRSPAYQWSMGNDFSYLFYLVRSDHRRDSSIMVNYPYYLHKISEVYKGRVRDFVMYSFIDLNLVAASSSFEKFSERLEPTLAYVNDLKDKRYKKELLLAFAKKERELINKKVGEPAIPFALKDSADNEFTLTDFKGKVVLIDFWASWCGPCRKENEYIRALHKKYGSDNRLAIISIAVKDKYEAWKNALRAEQPRWLQLFDREGSMAAAYITNGIPKFVIIDKQGKIASLEAPMPSDESKLENVLMREMARGN